MKKSAAPVIYQALQSADPVRLRPALCERVPVHADMLRYDVAFCNPEDISLVVFPVFKGYRPEITIDRWRSFGIRLVPSKAEFLSFDAWVTYVHPAGHPGVLVAQTLREYMSAGKKKIVGWSQL